MSFDFDKVINRRDSDSLKWDVDDKVLPMWVADMDFEAAPAIVNALKKRVEQGVFGYNIVPDSWKESVISWWSRRHGFTIHKDWILFSTGVVPTISSVVRKLTTPGENVLIMTPVYNIFYNSILNNGRHVLECPLVYKNGQYDIDFEDFEKKLSNPQTSLLLLCNPQNPSGNIWDKDTLMRIGNLCKKYHVYVLSDEIHCDLTDPGYDYVPFAGVSEECRDISITCISPTKAFNIAGIQTSAVVVPDAWLRHRVNRGLNTDEVAEPNSFAIAATKAAFNDSEDWLEELRSYLKGNKDYVIHYIEENIPDIQVVQSHATYLMWIDCSRITEDTKQLCAYIRKETGLYLSYGAQYGGNGNRFIRLNIACSNVVVREGMNRLREGIYKYTGRKL